jgi:hypothetical protein
MSTHGYSGFKRFFLGSVTDRVIRAGQTPVLVVCNLTTEAGSFLLLVICHSGISGEAALFYSMYPST